MLDQGSERTLPPTRTELRKGRRMSLRVGGTPGAITVNPKLLELPPESQAGSYRVTRSE